MKISILNKKTFDVYICLPRVSVFSIDKDIDDLQVGPQFRDLDTVLYFSRYDYGYVFEFTILGLGISIWVARNLL